MSEDRPEGLDPDRALREAAHERPVPPPAPAPIDTRRYRWTIGIFGLALVIAFSIYTFASRGVQTEGVPPGQRLHRFVAPLATSGLDGDANVHPRCDPRHPNPQALNVCGRQPIVLAFFVVGSNSCEQEVDTLQAVAPRYRGRGVTFAAVAVQAGRSSAAAAVRRNRWTIPVAYDRDGALGDLYGVQICPLVELAGAGGTVVDRLIGNHWTQPSALASRVQAMLGARG